MADRKIPIVFFCNKQDDKEGAHTETEIRDNLNVGQISAKEGIIFDWRSGSGYNSTGIEDAFNWIFKNMPKKAF